MRHSVAIPTDTLDGLCLSIIKYVAQIRGAIEQKNHAAVQRYFERLDSGINQLESFANQAAQLNGKQAARR